LRAFQAAVVAWADTGKHIFGGPIKGEGGKVGEEGGGRGNRRSSSSRGGRGVIHANYCFLQHLLVA
jgi:hypothetical protein